MKKNLEQIIGTLNGILPVLKSRYSVNTIEIFGSYIRSEENPNSDLDILVSFDVVPGLLKYMELENYLSDTLSIKVDLVMKDSIKIGLKDIILHDAVAV
jgi:predicted nucleotidyltransferase